MRAHANSDRPEDTPVPPSALTTVRERSGLGGAVRSVSLVSLLSRLFGLVRDLVIVRLFGDTAVGSAFAAAFAIPNMFRRLLGEGALSAAFIPEYARAAEQPRSTGDGAAPADGLATLVVVCLGLGSSVLVIALELLLLGLLLFTAPDADQRLSIGLIMTMLPFMPLICVTAILAGMLQVRGRMGLSMSGPIILNVFVVLVGGWHLWAGKAGQNATAYALGVATVLSGLTQAAGFAWALRKPAVGFDAPGVRWTRVGSAAWNRARPAARGMLKRFVPVVIGTGTLQLNAFLDMLIGMWPIWFGATIFGFAYPLDERSNAILSFTTRLYQFPLGVFGIAVATAAFPMLSRAAGNPDRFVQTIRRGIRLSLFIGLPASIGLLLVREDLVALLFGQWNSGSAVAEQGTGAGEAGGGGGFSRDGVLRSSAVLLAFSTGVWAYSLNHLFARVFYARGDTRTPMRVSIAMVLTNVTLNCVLIWYLREAGLAWSTSLCAMLQCVLLFWLARRSLTRGIQVIGSSPSSVSPPTAGQSNLLDAQSVRAIFRIAFATLVMALGVFTVQRLLQSGLVFRGLLDDAARASAVAETPVDWRVHAVMLLAAVATGLVVFLGACRALRVPEFGWLLKRSAAEADG